jgi:carbon storage regulator
MLVLTRKVNETIVIGNEIEVTVLGIKDDQVRLGVSAPQDIRIYRKEVFEAIAAENRRAAGSAGAVQRLEGLLAARKEEEGENGRKGEE